ncbi:MAG: NUDIX hydrolase [Hoeflea sp.]|uniref:NUDIX hydrolase n=1 Tax=Hoeflea sp. TaxID=1940281 RepID=UPI003EF37A27
MIPIPENRVFSFNAVQLSLDPAEHPWVIAQRSAIAANWARDQIERPWLFNGTVLLHCGLQINGGVISGTSHRVPYAALRHLVATWPDDDADAWHLFGSGLILTSDDAMLLIRMAVKTANPGKVYAPAGSLDESDITDGTVDVQGSILREAREETGVDLSGAVAENRLLGWRRGQLVAVFRRFRLEETAEVLVRRITEHIRTDPEQEIADVVVVRRAEDAGPTAPPHMQAMIDFHFGTPDFAAGWQDGGIG